METYEKAEFVYDHIKAWAYMPMIYANAKWLTTQLDLMQLTDYEIWYADYQEEPIYPYQFRICR